MKYVNSQTKNNCPGNDGLTAEFYKHFSNELHSNQIISYFFRCV